MNSFDNSNRGIFNISSDTLYSDLPNLLKIFQHLEIIPVRVEHLFMSKSFQYVGYSPNFRKVIPEAQTPIYNVTINIVYDPKTQEDKISAIFEEQL